MTVLTRTFGAVAAGLFASTALAQTEIVDAESGVEACPAYDIIQQRILEVVRGTVTPGTGQVSPEGDGPVAAEFILDASGSMGADGGGRSKMAIALAAFEAAAEALDGANVTAALRAYGFDSSLEHSAEASCPNTELLTEFARDNASGLTAAARGLVPYGYTPIAGSLEAAGADLAGVEARERLIVLISDGEETCGGDPVAMAASLREQGINLSAYVVGFDLDADQEAQMRAIAEAGGGRYLDAPDADALAEAMREAVGMTVRRSQRTVLKCENPVLGGHSAADAIPLEPGIYTLGEFVPRGEYRYYRIATQEGELGVVRGLLQSHAWHGEGDDLTESSAALGAMTIRMLNPDGERAGSGFPRVRNLPGEGLTGYYADTTGEGFIIAVGDNYDRTAADALFEIAIEPAHDGTGGDADDTRDGEHPVLQPGETGAGHVGHDDLADIWRAGTSGPVTVAVSFENEEMRYGVEVYDAETGRRLARSREDGHAVSLDVEAEGPVLVRIETREPRLASRFSGYSVTVSPR
ncbi:vWA domain-containing protein [Hyphobacterium marinum]|uniref:VWA domain-containing protein n=1 Tax=Hyphobacterium marinum TaxID=3116574 RepID=A0ABU7LUM1_9PROT|nr:VWA domain-containing protein [Hyphobacterium sp. Y6023]MEE2565263.1 VWA domain-containing protein [Hyphobacterium sp. Y6023]